MPEMALVVLMIFGVFIAAYFASEWGARHWTSRRNRDSPD